MIRRHWPILTIGAAVLAAGLTVQAQPPAKMPTTPPAATTTPAVPPTSKDFNAKEILAHQQKLEIQYKAFTRNLLALAQKLKNSDRVEDQDKAKTLLKAIDVADKEAVDNKFTSLLRTLSKSGDITINDLNKANQQNDEIIKAMAEILRLISSDDDLERIKREKAELEKHLTDLNGLIRGIKVVQARTNSERGDPKKIGEDQKKLADQTDKLADRMGANKAGNRNTPGEQKSSAKGEGKNGEGKGENKEDTNKPKGEERNAKMGEPKDPMGANASESKGSKGMEGSASESKPSMGMGAGMPSESKGSESKGMGGMGGMMGDPKDPMMKDPKNPMGMGGDKKDDKNPAEARNKEDNKGEQKGSASPSGGMKPPSDSQASSKSEGSPMSGSPSGSGKPSGGSPSGSPPPPGGQKPPAPGADNVRKAVPDEDNAAGNLDDNKRKQASDDQSEAARKLEEARQELEKRLKQLREQELERLLANLEARVNKMLAMQIEVKNGTVNIDTAVQKYEDKKPKQIDFQNSQKQSDTEGLIIAEADKAIQLLRDEGSAVAFPAVFEEVRVDMVRVRERLQTANVGKDTQDLEDDIITALKQMAEALKKAQQEIGKQPPMPPGPPGPDQPQMQKLLDEIAELKMIRQLQAQVNDRTKRYGSKDKAEQTDDPQTKKELKDLSDRQEKIETMINNMATKKNQ